MKAWRISETPNDEGTSLSARWVCRFHGITMTAGTKFNCVSETKVRFVNENRDKVGRPKAPLNTATGCLNKKRKEAKMEILRTKTLDQIHDGAVAMMIDEALSAVYADCDDRPGLAKARKVTIEISITPNGESPMTHADVGVFVGKKIPPKGVQRTMKASTRNNGFAFSPDTDSIEHDERQQNLID